MEKEEQLEKAMGEYRKTHTLDECIGFSDGFNLGYTECSRANEKAAWVSVLERLPEDYSWVLCMADDGTVLEMMYCDDTEENGCWHNASEHFKKRSFKEMGVITHWCSLPEGPQENK